MVTFNVCMNSMILMVVRVNWVFKLPISQSINIKKYLNIFNCFKQAEHTCLKAKIIVFDQFFSLILKYCYNTLNINEFSELLCNITSFALEV